jgi:biopolymer transport protein ExbD
MALGSNHDADDPGELHEINVTPLIDVMLVLLIIFMVAAPLATVDLPVNLPRAAVAEHEPPPKPVMVTLLGDGTLAIAGQPIDRQALAAALDAASEGDRQRPVFLRADRTVAYGDVVETLSLIGRAGYARASLLAIQAR